MRIFLNDISSHCCQFKKKVLYKYKNYKNKGNLSLLNAFFIEKNNKSEPWRARQF